MDKLKFNISNEVTPQARTLRHKVFVIEEGAPECDEFTGDDDLFCHFYFTEGDKIVAYARATKSGELKIGRLAVERDYRKLGIGSRLMCAVEAYGRRRGCERVVIHAQVQAENFYKKIGYIPVGKPFLEAKIDHIIMEKALVPEIKQLDYPFRKEDLSKLNAGDIVSINGTLYTARDAAHKRLVEALRGGQKLPFDLRNNLIYYTGACPPKAGEAFGSAGPTTSKRMDAYTPYLLDNGLAGAIGKGERGAITAEAFKKERAVYFAAVGGAGAYYGNRVKSAECIAYPDLLSEAVYKIEVKDFRVIVALDALGVSVYK